MRASLKDSGSTSFLSMRRRYVIFVIVTIPATILSRMQFITLKTLTYQMILSLYFRYSIRSQKGGLFHTPLHAVPIGGDGGTVLDNKHRTVNKGPDSSESKKTPSKWFRSIVTSVPSFNNCSLIFGGSGCFCLCLPVSIHQMPPVCAMPPQLSLH